MSPARPFHEIKDWLFAHDPGFVRLRLALQGTSSVAVSFFLLAYIFRYGKQSATLALAGVTLAMIASLVVTDETPEAQKRTVLLMPLPAVCVLLLGILLKPWPLWNLLVFLLVVFLSVFIRRYGPRGMAIGMICFMSYFYSIFFPIPSSALTWVIFSIVLGLGIVYVIRFWAVPEHPRYQLSWATHAFRVRASELLELAHRRLSEGRAASSRDEFRAAFLRVNETALQVDDFLKRQQVKSAATESWIFDLELSLRRFIEAVSALASQPALPAELRDRIALLVRDSGCLVRRPRRRGENPYAALPEKPGDLPDSLRPLYRSVRFEYDRLVALAAGPVTRVDAESAEITPDPPPSFTGLHRNTKQAIQVTLAAGTASVVGALISPDRWYWAALTAFIVFSGATRGDTMLRAVQRVLGTLLGLVAGFLLAYAFVGSRELQGLLAFVCIFAGLYCARVFPTGTVFWFTALFAVFYQLMGILTRDVLMLRLEETLVGAVAGSFAAFWVLPTSTRSAVRDALSTLLRRAAVILEEATRLEATGESRGPGHYIFLRRLRLLDRDLVNLRNAAAPMTGRIVARTAPDTYRRLHDASALVHFVRHVAFGAANDGALRHDEAARAQALRVSESLKSLAERVMQKKAEPSPDPWPVVYAPVPAGVEATPHWLNRIEQLVRSLGR